MGIKKEDIPELKKKAWSMYIDGYYIWQIAKELSITEAVVVKFLNL